MNYTRGYAEHTLGITSSEGTTGGGNSKTLGVRQASCPQEVQAEIQPSCQQPLVGTWLKWEAPGNTEGSWTTTHRELGSTSWKWDPQIISLEHVDA